MEDSLHLPETREPLPVSVSASVPDKLLTIAFNDCIGHGNGDGHGDGFVEMTREGGNAIIQHDVMC